MLTLLTTTRRRGQGQSRRHPRAPPAGTGPRQRPDHTSTADFLHKRFRTYTPRELVALATSQPPLFEPDTSWSYSNTNYILLGLVIEHRTGQPLETVVSQRILRPLGLRDTELPGTSPFLHGPHAHGYLPIEHDGQIHPLDITILNPSAPWAAGAIISTTADLNRLYHALLGGHLLPPAQLQQMICNPTGRNEYGLGISRLVLPCGITLWGHTGVIQGKVLFSVINVVLRRRMLPGRTTSHPHEQECGRTSRRDVAARPPASRVAVTVRRHGDAPLLGDPAAPPSRIAAATGLQRTNLSTTLRGLETKGLIERRTSPDDRRGVTVHVTEHGRTNYHLVRHEWATGVAHGRRSRHHQPRHDADLARHRGSRPRRGTIGNSTYKARGLTGRCHRWPRGPERHRGISDRQPSTAHGWPGRGPAARRTVRRDRRT
ncbi:serine hydrolase [Actinophytocola sp.]|uniref:serine hydrolase n=1 Tax=Actinophytocola sp. TaxID=1872138 RepID=UPI002ED27454